MSYGFRRFGEAIYIDLVMPPAANPADATVPASYKDVSEFERFGFMLTVGATDDTSVTIQIVQATAAAGTGKKNVTGAVNTATVLAGTNDNKLVFVECQQNQLDINGGFRYVAVDYAASGGTATVACVHFFAWRGNAAPVTQPATVAELVYLDG